MDNSLVHLVVILFLLERGFVDSNDSEETETTRMVEVYGRLMCDEFPQANKPVFIQEVDSYSSDDYLNMTRTDNDGNFRIFGILKHSYMTLGLFEIDCRHVNHSKAKRYCDGSDQAVLTYPLLIKERFQSIVKRNFGLNYNIRERCEAEAFASGDESAVTSSATTAATNIEDTLRRVIVTARMTCGGFPQVNKLVTFQHDKPIAETVNAMTDKNGTFVLDGMILGYNTRITMEEMDCTKAGDEVAIGYCDGSNHALLSYMLPKLRKNEAQPAHRNFGLMDILDDCRSSFQHYSATTLPGGEQKEAEEVTVPPKVRADMPTLILRFG